TSAAGTASFGMDRSHRLRRLRRCRNTRPSLDRAGPSGPREQTKPVGPVAAQLEEVVEVHEADLLQLGDERTNRVFAAAVDRTDGDQVAVDSEFVWREA